MIIDFHVHVSKDEKNCIRDLLKADDKFGIDKSVIFCPDNDFTLKAAKAHPDRLVPFGWIGWGKDAPSRIDELADAGVRGMKVIYPAFHYNDPRLFPYYARAEARGLPLLVHTGIVARMKPEVPNWEADTDRMQVLQLDGPCRAFPKLTIVAAHMGNPDHERGAMMARWHPNFYFDLSGSSLLHRSHQYFRDLFWWERETRFTKKSPWKPFEKMVFATDEPYARKDEPMLEQKALLEALGQSKEIVAKVLGGTAAKILRIKK